jgi:hypothetical protein
MSGGLLEKAQSQDNDAAVTPDKGVVAAVEDVEAMSGGGLLERASSEGPSDGGPGFDPSMVKKGVAASIVTLLILFIAYQAVMGFSLGGYSISVSDVDVDESDNTLSVQVFIGTPMFKSSPNGEMSMTISYGPEKVWTGSFSVDSKLGWYDVSFTDFYQNNSRGAASDGSDIVYSISVTLEDSSSDSYPIPGELSDRTITAVDGELEAVTQPNDNCVEWDGEGNCKSNENNGIDHLGATLRVGAGVPDPVEGNTSGVILHADSDYTITASIYFDGADVFTFPVVTVDGSAASWGGGSGIVEDAWFDLDGEGEKTDAFGQSTRYIPRDSFYQEDGCYTITISVTQNAPFGDVYSDTSSQGWEFFWEYNENRDTDNTDGSSDPYKPTETC